MHDAVAGLVGLEVADVGVRLLRMETISGPYAREVSTCDATSLPSGIPSVASSSVVKNVVNRSCGRMESAWRAASKKPVCGSAATPSARVIASHDWVATRVLSASPAVLADAVDHGDPGRALGQEIDAPARRHCGAGLVVAEHDLVRRLLVQGLDQGVEVVALADQRDEADRSPRAAPARRLGSEILATPCLDRAPGSGRRRGRGSRTRPPGSRRSRSWAVLLAGLRAAPPRSGRPAPAL